MSKIFLDSGISLDGFFAVIVGRHLRQNKYRKMKSLNKIEIAARNKENYLKAKEAFNNKRVDECILFYATNHEVKSKQSEKGRDGIQKFIDTVAQLKIVNKN